MTYKTKEQFIQVHTIRKLVLVEYIKNLEIKGLGDTEIQAELLKNGVVKTPRTLDNSWKFYSSVRNKISWI